SRWPPSSKTHPAARSLAAASLTSLSGRASVAVTRAPCAAQNSAVAMPVRARPTTSTRLRFNSYACVTPLPQFQRRQRKKREDQRRDPEPNTHFRFAPAVKLEVMENRSLPADAL